MMEAAWDRAEAAKTHGSMCLSELDQGFLTDHNLSALPPEGALKAPKSIVVEYTEPNPTLPASSNASSPSNPPNKMSLLSPTVHSAGIGLLEGKSSTPYERMTFQKPVVANSWNLSSIDLTTLHPSWEVSLIKPSTESPKVCLDSGKAEFTWSPTLAEISSLIWSGTPNEGQRSCRKFTFQDSNLRHTVLELTDEQQKSLSQNLAK